MPGRQPRNSNGTTGHNPEIGPLRSHNWGEFVMFNRRNVLLLLLTALMGINISVSRLEGQNTAPLLLKGSVNLPGYTGDFDHFAVDQARGRLLLAAEDHGTVEVFDLNSGKHLQTIKGFETPHSILIRPGAATILVTDSGKGMSKLLDASTYRSERRRNACAGCGFHWLRPGGKCGLHRHGW